MADDAVPNGAKPTKAEHLQGDNRPMDAELLSAWGAGDSAAGQTLCARHFESIYRFFRNKLRSEAIDDLVQRTFLACVEARDRFRGESSFRSFLFQIARYQLYEYFRASQRDQILDFSVTTVHDLGTSPTGRLAWRDDERLLLDALKRLPVELQIVIELVFWEDLTAPEIAQVLEIPANTVYSRIRRAKELLREGLEAAALTPSTAPGSADALESWLRSIRPAFDVKPNRSG